MLNLIVVSLRIITTNKLRTNPIIGPKNLNPNKIRPIEKIILNKYPIKFVINKTFILWKPYMIE